MSLMMIFLPSTTLSAGMIESPLAVFHCLATTVGTSFIASGNLLAMNEVPTVVAKQWKTAKGDSIIPALNVVLGKKIIISDIWNYGEKGMMKVGVAPVIDPDAPVSAKDPEGVVIIGAIVVGYAQTAKEAQKDRNLLGTEIAYYDNK